MNQNKQFKTIILGSRIGCLLPVLIIFNLFFGLFFLKPLYWLALEAVLIMLCVLTFATIVKKVSSLNSNHSNVIDVEGKIVENRKKLPE